jgi:hypothetical protein
MSEIYFFILIVFIGAEFYILHRHIDAYEKMHVKHMEKIFKLNEKK